MTTSTSLESLADLTRPKSTRPTRALLDHIPTRPLIS
nr:MAG TPA: hypothetical protein [Crassvirales sp.]